MNRMIRGILAGATVVGLLSGGYSLAAEPTHFDYTGLPVTETVVEEAMSYTTIPASLIMQDCKVVGSQDDYTGAEMTRCAPREEPELEWSYLY